MSSMGPPNPAAYRPPQPCFRHGDRPTLIACQRCGRPICPECMITAAVGVQCPECVREGVRQTRSDVLPFGGRRIANQWLTTGVLMGVNAVVWLLITLTGGALSPWYNRLALLPAGRCVPVDDPGSYAPDVTATACRAVGGLWHWIPGVADGAVWQLLTSAFSHVTVWHIGSNMLMLGVIGPVLDRTLGRARFLGLYFLTALGSAAAVYWFADPASSTLGASGALFGLLGALLVMAAKVRGNLQNILTIVGINLAATFLIPNVSWEGHLGGLATGAALGALLVYAPRDRRTLVQAAGAGAFLVLTVIAVVIRTLLLR